MKKGIKQGIGIFVGFFMTAAFAFVVSGTVKTWTSGETLTAADLNTTVQSLKTAVENAAQVAEASVQGGGGTTYYRTFLGNVGAATSLSSTMTRAGTVKNTSVIIGSNTVGANCTVTLLKNGVDSLIQLTVPSGSTTTVTDADTVSFIATDTLAWRTVCTSGVSQNLFAIAQFEF